jgi:hypothetical protein
MKPAGTAHASGWTAHTIVMASAGFAGSWLATSCQNRTNDSGRFRGPIVAPTPASSHAAGPLAWSRQRRTAVSYEPTS